MTLEQQKILEQFDDSTLFYFLREIRNKAFISWAKDDVIGQAAEYGFVMNEEDAINIISEIDRRADCTHGITWDTLQYYVDEWVIENSFEVVIKEHVDEEPVTTKFCSLETNEDIENYWNDGDYYFYGTSKEELKEYIGKVFTGGECIIIKIN